MGAVNEAAIRVTANTAPFQADMRTAASRVKSVAGKMGRAVGDALGEGFEEGKKNAKELVGSVRDITSQVLTLGGAVSGGAMIVGAVRAQKSYASLANVLSVVRDRTVSAAEAQLLVEDAAVRTGTSFEDMRVNAQNMTTVAQQGMEMADALVRAQNMANRFNVEGDKMAEVWGRVIGGEFAGNLDEAEALIEQIGVTMLKTGVAMEDAFNPSDVMEFLAKMKQFGVPVQTGIVMLEHMKGTVRDLGEALELPEELGEMLGSTKGLLSIRDASKLTEKQLSKNMSIAQNLITVLQAGPEAFRVLQAGLGEKATIGFESLLGVDIIEAAAKSKLKTADLEKAIGRVDDAFSRAAEVQFDAAAVAKRNAALNESAGADFQNALNTLESAFQSEKVTEAISKVAKELPKIVDPIADIVAMVAANPWTSVTALVGGKLALAVGGPMVTAALSKGVTALFARAAAVQVASTAASVATRGATTLGVTGAAGAVGGATAASAAAIAAGVASAAAVGGAIGYAGYKAEGGVEDQQTREARSIQEAQLAVTDASLVKGDANQEQLQRTLRELTTRKSQMESARMGGGFGLMGEAAAAMTGQKSPDDLRAEAAAKIDAESARLIAALSRIGAAAEGASKGLDSVKDKTGGATRGTTPLPQATGSAPVPG